MITVYTRPGCVQCTMTKKALDQIGADYQLVDVEQDTAAAEQLRAAGHLALPVVTTPDDTWTGFRPDKISTLG